MILYFSIENYRSIGMEQEIFFEPNTDKIHSEKLLSTENYRALPVIPIYGGNATGKTNILRALKTLQELINGDKNIKESYERCQFIQKKHTSFKVNFLKNNIKYHYLISYSSKNIKEEALYYYPHGKPSKIFHRKLNNFSFGSSFEGTLKKTMEKNSKERPFLYVAGFWDEKIENIKDPYDFFKEDIIFLNFESNKDSIKSVKQELSRSKNQKKITRFMNTIFKELNTGIIGLRVGSLKPLLEEKEIVERLIAGDTSIDIKFKGEEAEIELNIELLRKLLLNNEDIVQLIYDIDGKHIGISIEEESKGIQKIFMLGMEISEAVCNQKVLLFDELETGFHPILSKKIIEIFMNEKPERLSQLIFSTHDTNLLDLEIFRRDQIYFTEKSKDSKYQTVIKPLSEIRGIRKTTDMEKEYLKGKYCSFPQLKTLVQDILDGLDN